MVYLLVSGRCGEWERHLFFVDFHPILHVAFIHSATEPPTARRRRRWWWKWWEDSGPIRACWCGWDPTSWTLHSWRAAHAAHCPWACSLKNWMSTSCYATPCSGHIPTKHGGIDYIHLWKGVRRCVWMLSGGWCRPLHQISGSDSARLGIVWERGRRLRASSACHPCPCRDRARILTADLRCHHSRKIRRGGKVQKGTCPSPLFLQ